jgi:hypothetical protein
MIYNVASYDLLKVNIATELSIKSVFNYLAFKQDQYKKELLNKKL